MMLGYYGKLPSHGDFLDEGLPRWFVAAWDAWLQRGMLQAEALLGADLDDVYDAAPVWSFAAARGVLHAEHPVSGVLALSRDRVGRLFPCTLACVGAQPDNSWFEAACAAMTSAAAGGVEPLRAFLAAPPATGEDEALVSDPVLWRADGHAFQAPLDDGLFLRLLQPAQLADHGGCYAEF